MLGIKPDFFIYLVKPAPKSDTSTTYLEMFSAHKNQYPKYVHIKPFLCVDTIRKIVPVALASHSESCFYNYSMSTGADSMNLNLDRHIFGQISIIIFLAPFHPKAAGKIIVQV
jgi:hypothetical protein